MKFTPRSVLFLLGMVALIGGALVMVQAKNPPPPESTATPSIKTVKSEDDTVVFAFDFDTDTDGWTADADLGPLTVIDGVLRPKAAGSSLYLISAPVDFAGEDVTNLKIRMWASERTQAQLFWRTAEGTFSDALSYRFDIQSRGGWQVHNLDLATIPEWTSAVIHELRLRPSDAGIDFGIDYIHGIDGSAVVIPTCGCKTGF